MIDFSDAGIVNSIGISILLGIIDIAEKRRRRGVFRCQRPDRSALRNARRHEHVVLAKDEQEALSNLSVLRKPRRWATNLIRRSPQITEAATTLSALATLPSNLCNRRNLRINFPMESNTQKLIHSFSALADLGQEIADSGDFIEMVRTSLHLLLGTIGISAAPLSNVQSIGKMTNTLALWGLGESTGPVHG